MDVSLQELITRGRFIFSGAPERLKIFHLLNGRRSAKEIAKTTKRQVTNVLRDLKMMRDLGLIIHKTDKKGEQSKAEGSSVYEKAPLMRHIPLKYLQGPSKPVAATVAAPSGPISTRTGKLKRPSSLAVPTETEILEICKKGEDQIYEFKAPGTEVRKVVREIGAMLNTRQGGIILYGIDDSGTIIGADVPRTKFDQPLQNSIRSSISPAASVQLRSVTVMGTEILVIIVPPWNRRDVYQFDEKVLLRKGTNVFGSKPEESKKLHRGEYVI